MPSTFFRLNRSLSRPSGTGSIVGAALITLITSIAVLEARPYYNMTSNRRPQKLLWSSGGLTPEPLNIKTEMKALRTLFVYSDKEEDSEETTSSLYDNDPESAYCFPVDRPPERVIFVLPELPHSMSIIPGASSANAETLPARIDNLHITFKPINKLGQLRTSCASESAEELMKSFIHADYVINPDDIGLNTVPPQYLDFRDHFTQNMIANCYSTIEIRITKIRGQGDLCIPEIRFFYWTN